MIFIGELVFYHSTRCLKTKRIKHQFKIGRLINRFRKKYKTSVKKIKKLKTKKKMKKKLKIKSKRAKLKVKLDLRKRVKYWLKMKIRRS
jgi:hypothetical protein